MIIFRMRYVSEKKIRNNEYKHVLKLSPCSKCNLFLFWVIPRRLSSNCQRFGTHCRFHLHRQVNKLYFIPKRRQLELRRRRITQKGTNYNINMVRSVR